MFDKKKNAAESYGVIGLGRFGTALVKTLAAAGKEVIAVDKDEAKVKAVRGYTDYAFVIDELNETSLKETGMQNCGTVTVCIGEQVDISILTTMLVIKLGVPQVIAKAASEVLLLGDAAFFAQQRKNTVELACHIIPLSHRHFSVYILRDVYYIRKKTLCKPVFRRCFRSENRAGFLCPHNLGQPRPAGYKYCGRKNTARYISPIL